MSNRIAMQRCGDLIMELEECQRTHNLFERATGACFDFEKLVRMCRHEARLEDRRQHVERANEKRRTQNERWRRIEADED